ncbi:ATP-dependent Clp protease proteolytic subunit [Candidatus Kaiserbacteria bacterium]|nr:ATP-dependent Clp protease proteolytic subunit [Candidatus Kaiserbacteria bacterium]
MDRKKASRRIKVSDGEHQKALGGDFIPEDVHDYRIERPSFTIYLGGDPKVFPPDDYALDEPGVEHNMADRFEMNMSILSGIDPDRPILVKMSTCGGHWVEGMKMFGAILTCPNPVTVLATKWARSMTSIIPLAADRFLIRPPAQYMYHRGTYGFYGLDQEADTEDVQRRKCYEMMLRIYVARLKEQGKFSRWPEHKIRAMLEEGIRKDIDVWLEADEAKHWGFADAVFDGNLRTLRAKHKNQPRRERMLAVLRKPIRVEVKVS